MIYGFYENELPEYSDEWTSELQSEVTAAEVNNLVEEIKSLRLINKQLKADYDRVERERLEEASAKFRMGEAVQESEARVSRLEEELEILQCDLDNALNERDSIAEDEAASREEADYLRDELARTHKMFSDE